MELIKSFGIDLNKRELITFVGAGGKTTTMFNLARELRGNGKSVLVTTTTAIYYPEKENCDRILLLNNMRNIFCEINCDGVIVIGSSVSQEGKLIGVEPYFIDEVYSKGKFDYILVEGDGAKGKSIKVPANHEPVIPELSTTVIAVIGLDSIGKSINENNVHRVEQFCHITKKKIEDIITEEDVFLISINKKGIFKNSPCNSRKLLFLNKVRMQEDIEVAERIKSGIENYNISKLKNVSKEFNRNIDNVILGIKEGK